VKIHQVKALPISGTDYSEVYPPARRLYNQIKAHTKRRPYVRSMYFGKEKVFIELFWIHLNQKNRKERNKRLKFYGCGIELLRTSRQQPTTKVNPNKSNEQLHRSYRESRPLRSYSISRLKKTHVQKEKTCCQYFRLNRWEIKRPSASVVYKPRPKVLVI
jgi:hypothetical protein